LAVSMKRGEVWWVDFEPAVGSEVRKTRPAVIVSNDASNNSMSRVQVVPVTSNTSKVYVFESRIGLKGAQGKAMADQITTADKQRLKKRIGKLSTSEMLGIERSIKVQLGLR
jgi:mRNA interferase MazF